MRWDSQCRVRFCSGYVGVVWQLCNKTVAESTDTWLLFFYAMHNMLQMPSKQACYITKTGSERRGWWASTPTRLCSAPAGPAASGSTHRLSLRSWRVRVAAPATRLDGVSSEFTGLPHHIPHQIVTQPKCVGESDFDVSERAVLFRMLSSSDCRVRGIPSSPLQIGVDQVLFGPCFGMGGLEGSNFAVHNECFSSSPRLFPSSWSPTFQCSFSSLALRLSKALYKVRESLQNPAKLLQNRAKLCKTRLIPETKL